MTFNSPLLEYRVIAQARQALFRLSAAVWSLSSRLGALVSSRSVEPSYDVPGNGTPRRRYRLEIMLNGRTTGEWVLKLVHSSLRGDGIELHGARLNLRSNDVGRVIVEASCSSAQRARLVQFVDHASSTPGVSRVRWESIPGGPGMTGGV